MLTMNRATLLGHAGRNPEMRRLPSGDDVALFSLATTERFRRRDGTDGEDTEWHAVVAYGAAAEAVRKLLHKGDRVLVEGRIATRYWRDRTGIERRTTEIVVSGPQARVNVLTKRRQEPDGDDEPPGGAAPAATAGQVAPEPAGAAAVAGRATASAGVATGSADGDRSDSAEGAADGGAEGGENADVSAVAADAAEKTAGATGDPPGAGNQTVLPLVPADEAAGKGADAGIVRPSGGGGDGHE